MKYIFMILKNDKQHNMELDDEHKTAMIKKQPHVNQMSNVFWKPSKLTFHCDWQTDTDGKENERMDKIQQEILLEFPAILSGTIQV